MPALPEVAAGVGFVGRVEVLGQSEAHEQGHTNGNVGVAREVGVDLEAVAVEGHQVLKTRETSGVLKHAVDEVHRQVVRQEHLLQESIQDPKCGDAKLLFSQVVLLVELGNEVRRAHNGPGHQLGKEAHVEPKIQDVLDRLDVPAVHVHRIADGLERVERDADRQQDLIHPEPAAKQVIRPQREVVDRGEVRPKNLIERVGEEVGVLEVHQHKQVDDHTQGQPPFAPAALGLVYPKTDEVIAESTEQQDGEKRARGLVVKPQRGDEQEGVAGRLALVQKAEYGEHRTEKHPEGQFGEDHRLVHVGVERCDDCVAVGS